MDPKKILIGFQACCHTFIKLTKQIRATRHADEDEPVFPGFITPLASDNCFTTNFKDLRNGVSYYKHTAVNLFKHKKAKKQSYGCHLELPSAKQVKEMTKNGNIEELD